MKRSQGVEAVLIKGDGGSGGIDDVCMQGDKDTHLLGVETSM